jgi:sec-independent protein translocase protein TatC
MTFGEHLEELRRRIIVGLLGLLVVFIVAFVFQDELLRFYAQPFERARASVNEQLRKDWEQQKHGSAPATRLVDEIWKELRDKPGLIDAATRDRLDAIQGKELEEKPPQLDKLQSLATGEAFAAYMLVCMLTALLVAAPILIWQLWGFVAAGLYEHERKLVLSVLPFSLLLFFMGFAFGYFVLAELSVRFLISYGDVSLVTPHVAVGAYLGLLFLLLLVMGLVFQVPLIMTVLASVGLASPEFFQRKRRHCILAIFIIAAIITPPDYVSQLLVAGPMLLLFELGVWLSKGAARRRAERKNGAAASSSSPPSPPAAPPAAPPPEPPPEPPPPAPVPTAPTAPAVTSEVAATAATNPGAPPPDEPAPPAAPPQTEQHESNTPR